MAAQQLVIRAGVGFLYPAYKSLHAIMSEDREASLAWMRYWVVLAAFSLLETLLDPLLDFLPGYLLSKCIFLVWCMAPSSKSGSNLVFTQVCAERPVTSAYLLIPGISDHISSFKEGYRLYCCYVKMT